jgi:hypothetical protein
MPVRRAGVYAEDLRWDISQGYDCNDLIPPDITDGARETREWFRLLDGACDDAERKLREDARVTRHKGLGPVRYKTDIGTRSLVSLRLHGGDHRKEVITAEADHLHHFCKRAPDGAPDAREVQKVEQEPGQGSAHKDATRVNPLLLGGVGDTVRARKRQQSVD